jgi:hypothetical protein
MRRWITASMLAGKGSAPGGGGGAARRWSAAASPIPAGRPGCHPPAARSGPPRRLCPGRGRPRLASSSVVHHAARQRRQIATVCSRPRGGQRFQQGRAPRAPASSARTARQNAARSDAPAALAAAAAPAGSASTCSAARLAGRQTAGRPAQRPGSRRSASRPAARQRQQRLGAFVVGAHRRLTDVGHECWPGAAAAAPPAVRAALPSGRCKAVGRPATGGPAWHRAAPRHPGARRPWPRRPSAACARQQRWPSRSPAGGSCPRPASPATHQHMAQVPAVHQLPAVRDWRPTRRGGRSTAGRQQPGVARGRGWAQAPGWPAADCGVHQRGVPSCCVAADGCTP